MEKEEEISFKAITKGLGFHPFSDGLPYAPANKTPEKSQLTGLGATAAGRPTFAKKIPQLAPKSQVQAPKPYIAPSPLTAQPKAVVAKQTAEPVLFSARPREESFGFVYVLKRFSAYLTDTVLNCSLGGGALAGIASSQHLNMNLLISPGVIFVFATFLLVLNWALIAAQEIIFGATIGKKTFGLYLDAPTGTIFLRAIFFIFSVAFSGLGILWAVFDSKRRCWHDIVSGVQPKELAKI